ncbi:ribbon-helix-helix domain-containing protein [Sphingomonas qomolangmaensis]|uniref:Type II toxin-antitoxin system ParD family antitoxin n=1 Tax=Sphingomonas qomolangmaensis TaxID=2918765 RepID=A0ABY5LAK4_9SPHN|nr:type II toxin-antitoxin system ParD family antitoxin [Sphingomonas qomolangmaensis]UUL82976.1 type II toxin-antitoxin system ParD family antitoxin [Sphingomonas qomolangmaensis]
MGEVRKITIEIDEDEASGIDSAVAAGDYVDAEAAVRAAVRYWQHARDAEITRLRGLIAEGLASGDPQPVTDEWFEDIIRRGKARLAAARADL